MRKEAIKGLYKVDDIYYRNVKKFLFFPKTINNEIRWWETAEWKEVWIGCGIWRDVNWINPKLEFIKSI